MKTSKYISKYDYLAYFTKQPAMWFFNNSEIKASIDYELSLIKSKLTDFDEETDDEQIEIDNYDLYKQLKFEQQENNSYEYFLEHSKEVDTDNILIVQGNILDEHSKKHIVDVYKNFNCHVIDYDNKKYIGLNNEQLFEITINDIEKYDNLILFQPTFIWNKKGLVTKCDAFVKINNDITIIETKGTSSTKRVHLFDLFYQHKVVENSLVEVDYNNTYSYNYKLCIVDYVKAKKYTCPFAITETCAITKSPLAASGKEISYEEKRNLKRGIRNNNHDKAVKFYDSFLWTTNLIYEMVEDKIINNSEANKRIEILNLYEKFDEIISILKKHKQQLLDKHKSNPNLKPNEFVPSYQDKGDLKNTDFWMDLRKLYVAKGYDIFNYSGNFLKTPNKILEKIKPNISIDEFLNICKDNGEKIEKQQWDYELYFKEHLSNFNVNHSSWEYHISLLKDKKVYFDFESINTAIRAIDDSFPFLQAITQCSIIKDHSNGIPISEAKCLNMCCHPSKIDIQWMKSIIDNLYEGEEYSYVVFNKNFEKTRLVEMSNFINEKEYFNKVKCINDNIVDLADWYNYRGKKIKDKNGKEKKLECPIVIKQLHGFFSIKKVLPLVSAYNPQIYEETKCVSYTDGLLTVHNGTECQTQTTKYFFDCETKIPWEEFLKSIECYCENDVRAMIAVEYLAKDIVKNLKYYNEMAKVKEQ